MRTAFERRFTVERMARDYLAIYRDLPGVRRAAMHLPPFAAKSMDLQAVA